MLGSGARSRWILLPLGARTLAGDGFSINLPSSSVESESEGHVSFRLSVSISYTTVFGYESSRSLDLGGEVVEQMLKRAGAPNP